MFQKPTVICRLWMARRPNQPVKFSPSVAGVRGEPFTKRKRRADQTCKKWWRKTCQDMQGKEHVDGLDKWTKTASASCRTHCLPSHLPLESRKRRSLIACYRDWNDNYAILCRKWREHLKTCQAMRRWRRSYFDKTTKTVYEFLGCLWHGCTRCYPKRRNAPHEDIEEHLWVCRNWPNFSSIFPPWGKPSNEDSRKVWKKESNNGLIFKKRVRRHHHPAQDQQPLRRIHHNHWTLMLG